MYESNFVIDNLCPGALGKKMLMIQIPSPNDNLHQWGYWHTDLKKFLYN